MSEDIRGVTSLSDIEDDLRGTELRASRLARTASTRPVLRGIEQPVPFTAAAPATPQGGARLVNLRPPEIQRRYRTLLRMEGEFRPEDEYSYLISAVSQILEIELDDLLVGPAKAVAARLLAVLADSGGPVRVLETWVTKGIATIGTASVLLLALRRGLEKDEAIRDFLESHFTPTYVDLLRQNRIAPDVDRFREHYRNPACHGYGSFDAVAYERFALLTVAHRRLSAWYAQGPLMDRQPRDGGLLHCHLQESRRLPTTEKATLPAVDHVERLLALAAPHPSDLTIEAEPQFADQPRLRDLSPTASVLQRPFRLGDRLRFACRTNAACRVALIDVGTSGNVAVVLPNFAAPEVFATPGQTLFVPDGTLPGLAAFEVTGQPGRERLLALALRGELPAVLRPPTGNGFRMLGGEEIVDLAGSLERLSPADWAACLCEFEIRP